MHQCIHASLDQDLCSGVNRGRGLIEDQGRGIGNRGTCNGEKLSLALAEVCSVVLKNCIVTVWETPYEAVGICKPCGLYAFLVRGIKAAEADVVHDGACEEVGVLENDSETAPEVRLLDLVDVNLVKADLSVLDVVETVDQVDHRCLTCAGASDKGKLLARLCIHLDVMKDRFLRNVAEINAIERNCALKLAVGYCSVSLMRVLPSPHVCLFSGLRDVALIIYLGTHQLDITIVILRFLVHHLEDTAGSCAGHDYA